MKRTTYENIEYFKVLLEILHKHYCITYVDIPLNNDGDDIVDVVDSFIQGEIKDVEDIKDKEKRELIKDYKIDRNILIDLRNNYDRLVNICQELEKLDLISEYKEEE